MSISADLKFDGENGSYRLLSCNYGFKYNIKVGKPQGKPQGGRVELVIETSKISKGFIEWMINPNMTKSGSIIFNKGNKETSNKSFDIKFEEAYCVKFNEKFVSDTNDPMKITIEIVSKKLEINGVKHKNNWRIM